MSKEWKYMMFSLVAMCLMYGLSVEFLVRNRYWLVAGMFFFGGLFSLIFAYRFLRNGSFLEASLSFVLAAALVYLAYTTDWPDFIEYFTTVMHDTMAWWKGITNEWTAKWSLWKSGNFKLFPTTWSFSLRG